MQQVVYLRLHRGVLQGTLTFIGSLSHATDFPNELAASFAMYTKIPVASSVPELHHAGQHLSSHVVPRLISTGTA